MTSNVQNKIPGSVQSYHFNNEVKTTSKVDKTSNDIESDFSNHKLITGLLSYLENSPTAWHTVRETKKILLAKGFEELQECKSWKILPGKKYFTTRNGSSIIAFITPTSKPKSMCILGAHTDSPGLKLKPNPETTVKNMKMLHPEVYGGPILFSWFDRSLGLAGRISYLDEHEVKKSRLVHINETVAVVAHVAIHLDDSLDNGHKINRQNHLPAISTLTNQNSKSHLETLLKKIVPFEKLLGKELFLVSREKPQLLDGKVIISGRLDNLLGCHASLSALLNSQNSEKSRLKMICFWDNEEVGSRTYQGAASNFLQLTLERIVQLLQLSKDEYGAMRARSGLISIDVAHALHPNHQNLYEPYHSPLFGEGPVLKYHANQSYSTNSCTESWILDIGMKSKIPIQKFCVRSDTRCGSTIGNIVAPRLGLRTVDIGAPILSMHSISEKGCCLDHLYMYDLLTRLLTHDLR